jgi:hypothetical protein
MKLLNLITPGSNTAASKDVGEEDRPIGNESDIIDLRFSGVLPILPWEHQALLVWNRACL